MRAVFTGTLAALTLVCSAHADWSLAPVGGDEGSPFELRCPNFANLVGVDIYSRDDIDAVRPVCATAFGPTEIAAPETPLAPAGGRAEGANYTRLLCPSEKPAVVGAWIRSEDAATSGVNNIRLHCGIVGANEEGSAIDGPSFDGPAFGGSGGHGTIWGSSFAGQTIDSIGCPKNLVAVGLHGRTAGDWIHALGLICGEPGLTARKVGRFKPVNPVGQTAAAKLPGVGQTAYCESYSAAAVSAAVENRNLGCGGEGGRWTSDYDRHFTWCMGQNGDRTVPDEEAAARSEALEACRSAKDQ